MKKLFLICFLLSLFCQTYSVAQTKVIAHRGFWKAEGSAQNSIASLIKADSIGCYGCEFDVWLTKDEQLIVNHDPAVGGRFIENSKGYSLTKLKLSNKERVPTLKQYLKIGKDLKIKLILELKPLNTPERETLAVKKIIEMVKSMDLEERMEYITFSTHITKEFVRLASAGTPVYYLGGKLSPQELKEIGCAGADYNMSVFRKNPEWIAECHNRGLKINVWTVNKTSDMQWFIDNKADYITTDEPVILQEILNKK